MQVDVSSSIAYVMAPKEENEVSTIKRACQATMDLFNKFLKEQLMDLIDKDKVLYDDIILTISNILLCIFCDTV